MQRFLIAHGAHEDWRTATEQALERLGGSLDEANLGFLYATTSLAPHLHDIHARLKEATGVPHWIGSVGIGIACTGREYYETPALAMMIGCFPEDALCLISGVEENGLDRFVAANGSWYQRHRHHFGILHADPRNPFSPALIDQLAREVPGSFFVGGLSSSANDHYPQIADMPTEGGVSGALFGPSISVTTGLTQGCAPLGPRHRVTGCELNVIHTLDERPALDVLYEDIGEILARDPRRIAGYIFAGLPVAGSDGDYLVRNLIGLDLRSRRIAVGERVNPGQALMFCRRDGNSAREDLVRMLRDLRRRLPAPARGGVYYSCLGRGRYLFGDDSQELRLIRDHLGDIPLVGLFANGEICHNRLYGYTGVLSLFS